MSFDQNACLIFQVCAACHTEIRLDSINALCHRHKLEPVTFMLQRSSRLVNSHEESDMERASSECEEGNHLTGRCSR
jgi:hypothetical protein